MTIIKLTRSGVGDEHGQPRRPIAIAVEAIGYVLPALNTTMIFITEEDGTLYVIEPYDEVLAKLEQLGSAFC